MLVGYLLRRCAPHLLACTILLSCAAKPRPVEISVQVPLGYKGVLHISPCSDQTRLAQADEQGRAYTHECPQPGQEIEVVVMEGAQSFHIPSDKLNINKTGDGIPVEISTVVNSLRRGWQRYLFFLVGKFQHHFDVTAGIEAGYGTSRRSQIAVFGMQLIIGIGVEAAETVISGIIRD